jgi:hypothetical protein
MSAQPLTIVIPTRDRPRLLELCLRSIFERQSVVPPVIVSDNSTSDDPAIPELRRRYGFAYVRQTGQLGIVEHHNRCLDLPTTPWALLLHDDDEIYPGALAKASAFLGECHDAGIVITGVEVIDPEGRTLELLTPCGGSYVGEDAIAAVGLDWKGRAPGFFYRVSAFRQLGGFTDVDGLPSDYALALWLAYRPGVAFWPELFGRYRLGHKQVTSVVESDHAEQWLSFNSRQAALVRGCGCSAALADRIVDYITWSHFLGLAGRCREEARSTVFRLARTARQLSPHDGMWQDRARQEFAFVFWGPEWIAWPLFRARRKLDLLRRRWALWRGSPARPRVPKRWGEV